MFPKPKDQKRKREPNPLILHDGRLIFKKPSKAWDDQRYSVYLLANGNCEHCGRKTFFGAPEGWPQRAECDHIKLRGMGGANTDDSVLNLQNLCSKCHREKHDGKWKGAGKIRRENPDGSVDQKES